MSFTSIEFAILLGVIYGLLGLIRAQRGRKIILLSASCFFYAWWDWRFLGLLAFVTLLDYYISRFLSQSADPKRRKMLLLVSICANLGLLAFFKYFNFFINSLDVLIAPLGWKLGTLNILLPIGISFYIFETLSYVIDVYRATASPAKSLLDYAIFITFFPRLVAGPIMRAAQFLPQLDAGIHLSRENFIAGSQLFLRGLLKKLVLADQAATMVDLVYGSPGAYSSGTVWLAIIAYSIQIYCDFSGYTDMALGLGKTLGFNLPQNFNLPYTAQSLTEFWNRWHISLSTWLRDYLYIPLGGSRKGRLRTYLNLILTMLLGGLWHGASWNFVAWGGLNGAYLAIERLLLGPKPAARPWSSPLAWLRASGVFVLVTLTWVPFRSPDWATTLKIFEKLLFAGGGAGIRWDYSWSILGAGVVVLGGFLARRFDWKWPLFSIRHSYALAAILFEALLVFYFAATNASPFIYFQF